jgi:hypothetical protein
MDVTLPRGATYILVVDTDRYAGNFERQLAGFATGICDIERGHGEEEAQQALEADPTMVAALCAKSLEVRSDEYGMVTNTIRETPGRLNNGYGFMFPADDPAAAAEASAKAVEYARRYHASQMEMAQGRLDRNDFQTGEGGWTREACERTIEGALASIERAGKGMTFPAYESVAMFFSEPLTADEMTFVRHRAEAYAADPTPRILVREPFRILDVYMVRAEAGIAETRLDEPALA